MGDPDEDYISYAAYCAASVGRSLRLQISGEGLPPGSIRPVLVLCGRIGGHVQPHVRQVQVGSVTEVTVVGAAHLDTWLEGQRGGHIGPDFADRLLRDLRALAEQRDSTAIEAGWLLRRLARVN